jgi:hypothetical protein
MGVGNEKLLAPEDDNFHVPPNDNWWWHETCWFWFFVPERKLGGWLYNYVRPNIGVAGGGCWVWDDTSHSILEVPYYANYTNLQLPAERDLRKFRFPTGTTVEMLEPLKRYRLGHHDGKAIALDLEFDAIMEPWVAVGPDPRTPNNTGPNVPRHLDQVGRVTGTLMLHGDVIGVDCLAIRDRTWSPRPEKWKINPIGYTNAAADASTAFLFSGFEELRSGYLVLDGARTALALGRRRSERDSEHGYVTRMLVDGIDTEGRTLHAEGVSLSRMAMKIPGVHGVVWTSLMRWTINGIAAWGEDQDAWPLADWAMYRRRQRGLHRP